MAKKKKKSTKIILFKRVKDGEYALNQHSHVFIEDKNLMREKKDKKYKKKLIDSF